MGFTGISRGFFPAHPADSTRNGKIRRIPDGYPTRGPRDALLFASWGVGGSRRIPCRQPSDSIQAGLERKEILVESVDDGSSLK